MKDSIFYVGTSGWVYKHWKGTFYPKNLANSRWFDYYKDHFRSVEVNATFYRSFPDSTYIKWREQVDDEFRYVLKVPRLITHYKRLEDCEEDIRSFWRSASLLEDRLGMVLLQLSPNVPCDLERVKDALKAFGDPGRVAVEFRAECWQETPVRPLLEELGAAYVNVDSPYEHPAGWVTGPRAYIRLHGRGGMYTSDYNLEALDETAAMARQLADQGAKEIYIFFNNDVGGHAPKNALALQEMLGND